MISHITSNSVSTVTSVIKFMHVLEVEGTSEDEQTVKINRAVDFSQIIKVK